MLQTRSLFTSRASTRSWRSFQRCLSSNPSESHEALSDLPWQYLRALDPANYDDSTLQRADVPYDMENGKPFLGAERQETPTLGIVNTEVSDDTYSVEWTDGRVSNFPNDSLQDRLQRWKRTMKEDRSLWSGMTEQDVRDSNELSIPFDTLLTKDGMKLAMHTLYKYGVVLIPNTPVDDDGVGIAALGASLSGGTVKEVASNSILKNYQSGGKEIGLPHATDGPLRTLYGTVWSTKSAGQADGASTADSAYGNDGLPLHTDMTYMRDPPGLQIFTMVQPAIEGGESTFADGFAIAEALRKTKPESFEILSQTIRRYRSIDKETGWHLEASGSLIQLSPDNEIAGIRHNDLDRLPDLPPITCQTEEEIDEFYKKLHQAHLDLDTLIAKDEFRLVMKLQPGDTMVVANQRCMHGRFSFISSNQNPRSVMGCYIGQDELYSRMRMEGLHVH